MTISNRTGHWRLMGKQELTSKSMISLLYSIDGRYECMIDWFVFRYLTACRDQTDRPACQRR